MEGRYNYTYITYYFGLQLLFTKYLIIFDINLIMFRKQLGKISFEQFFLVCYSFKSLLMGFLTKCEVLFIKEHYKLRSRTCTEISLLNLMTLFGCRIMLSFVVHQPTCIKFCFLFLYIKLYNIFTIIIPVYYIEFAHNRADMAYRCATINLRLSYVLKWCYI